MKNMKMKEGKEKKIADPISGGGFFFLPLRAYDAHTSQHCGRMASTLCDAIKKIRSKRI